MASHDVLIRFDDVFIFRILTEQFETVRSKSFEIKLENGRLSSQHEVATERISVLQLRLDGAKKEAELLREKNNKLSNSVTKHEENVSTVAKVNFILCILFQLRFTWFPRES